MMKTCPICKENCSNAILFHLKTTHGITDEIDLLIYSSKVNKSTMWLQKFPENVLRAYLLRIKEINKLSKMYFKQFYSFFNHVSYVREFDVEKDLDLFFETILPWKLKYPGRGNSKELCKLESENEEQEKKIYQHFMLEKNPYYKHDGSMSPFSKDFIGYKDMSEEEKTAAVRKANKCETKEYKLRLEYWEKRYPDKEEAYKKWKEECNRHVFNLERCIKRHGLEEGTRIFNERNRKWIATLNSKPIEEIRRINKSKITRIGNKSTIELDFMSNLVKEENRNIYIKEAKATVDCLLGNKVIEFYGDYWHCNPRYWKEDAFNRTLHKTAKEKWNYDEQRIRKIKSLGYEVKIVWETDYEENKEQVIKDCKEFLGVN